MKTVPLCLALALAFPAAVPAIGAEDTPSNVVAFHASVRVDVDASGKPVKVEAPADLPDAIRAFVEKRVASWQYQPAKLAGVPQAATTYVAVNACAVPVAQGYRLGIDFNGNGARVADGKPIPPPLYPGAARRSGIEAEYTLILGIETDGQVVIDQIEKADVSNRRGAGEFEAALRRWVKLLRFEPEIVAGSPVRGQVRMPVDFMLFDDGDRRALLDALQDKAKASRECQIASGSNDTRPVAMSPAVTVIPSPAS